VKIEGVVTLVTGGASGLGLATARHLLQQGAKVVIADLATSKGAEVAQGLGQGAMFVSADVTDTAAMESVLDAATAQGPLRALVHCAGREGMAKILNKDGTPGSLDEYAAVLRVNLVGTFNSLRLAAARMNRNEPVDGERGVCVLTASIAAYEGQIGQSSYASSKAGVVGLTLVAARELARNLIRVCSIAPGLFDTPLLGRLPESVRGALAASVPHPARLGDASEFAALAAHIVENRMLNGETIRLDGALRMAPR
jgi:NAD(P)-dependent dehydrogenase (short-subunit alcohol dehydrogenase family)